MALTNILVAGAGKSTSWLIKFLLDESKSNKWHITVMDGNEAAIAEKIGQHPNATAAPIDIHNVMERQALVRNADLVLSLMPPQLHILLAHDCLQFGKNLITSSYISPEMKELDEAVKAKGLMFMCEMGLDPGIDHMSANQIIHSIQRVAGTVTSFISYCGGLIAPESDDNPWHYKFSWNPRNILEAGKAGAIYLENGNQVQVGYPNMFRKRELIEVPGSGPLAWYPNRDSLKYLNVYDVPDVHTFLRATFRHPEFCEGWNALVTLGITDSERPMPGSIKKLSDLSAWLLGLQGKQDIRKAVIEKLQLDAQGPVPGMLEWLGLFSNASIPADSATPGDALFKILEEKWAMKPNDKDLVVMQHEVLYEHKGRTNKLCSTMQLRGENRELTAMAKTVGLPMGVLAKLILKKRITAPQGVLLPGMPSVYKPVLAELAKLGIAFQDNMS
ncbi:MAG: saccharopine dehydrogenase NADP-binding domain-containing protein [Bacteroidetes bacterium]|nr:saccharopine dehydrogenase NADP-binding domain-containing protein [Bacteroidota bacterium]MBS1629473.1 saccharopine dehydrogenase NADP-binding domain-containing protein [Bacteroidota bacterium]